MPISDKALEISRLVRLMSGKMGRTIRVATAESCTGGRIAAALTAIPGASEWFHTGVVAYTKESKQNVLGIPSDILAEGLITEATAKAMAEGAARLSGADFALSTTGSAGPSPSEGREPLTVWIGLRTPIGTLAKCVQAEDRGRAENQSRATLEALTFLSETIAGELPGLDRIGSRDLWA